MITGFGALACILGYFGFRHQAVVTASGDSYLDLAYRTVQLFVLESGYTAGGVPWQLEIARVLAPLVAAGAALQALGVLFREQREAFWLRRRKDHVIVCGLGRKGMQLVRDFRAAGDDVVVIELDENNPRLTTCRYLGARTLAGGCTDKSLLQRARADRARHIIAITGDDSTNVEVAILARQLVHARNPGICGIVRCYVHVVDLKLCQLLEHHDLLSAPGDRFETRIFNSFQNSARSLSAAFPLEPLRFGPDDPRRVHLVVIGFGRMGESVAVQAAKLGHYANGQRMRVTVIDVRADQRRVEFANRYPQMDKVCDFEFVVGGEDNRDIRSRLGAWASEPGFIVSIAVCVDGDSQSLACALNVMTAVRPATVPIFVRMSADSGLATMFAGRPGTGHWVNHIHPFGMTTFNATRTVLLNQERDILARAFHRDYVAKRKLEGKPEGEAGMQGWEHLGVGFQDSNRQMADHLPVKLRAIGCSKAPSAEVPAPTAFTAEEVELLARMEHARWNAERLLAGWSHGVTDRQARTSAHLVGWDDLPEDIREYDRQAVRCIPRVLGLVDEGVQRLP